MILKYLAGWTDIDFSQYKGKKIMIVNTASKCGNTPQYKDLETLYEKYKDKLVIVGFPANNFGEQEPGSNEDIKAFCTKNYGVTFPMAEKVSVKGDDIHPLYKWLVDQSKELAKICRPIIKRPGLEKIFAGSCYLEFYQIPA